MYKFNQTCDLYSPEIYHSADEIYHYGVLGMKWRHHKARLAEYDRKLEKGTNHILSKTKNMNSANKQISNLSKKLDREYKDSIEYKIKRDKRIKAAKVIAGSAIVAGGALAVYKMFKKKGIKFETERARKAREWAAESKRLDNLMSNSTKNLNKFSNEFITKDNLNRISSSRKTVSSADVARMKKTYDMFFK